MNKIIIIGNLVKDPELSTTTNGLSVARFTLAVQRKFKNADGEYDTDFLNCVAWRQLADTCKKYLTKGKKAALVGSIQTRSYDSTDGTKKYVTEILADEVEFLSPVEHAEEKQEAKPIAKGVKPKLEEVDDDSLPF